MPPGLRKRKPTKHKKKVLIADASQLFRRADCQRTTMADKAVPDAVNAFHRGDATPAVSHFAAPAIVSLPSVESTPPQH